MDSLPAFNGASCLVCIDVFGVGTGLGLDWASKHRTNPALNPPSDEDIADAIIAKIDAEAAKCPAGAVIKLQLLYHCDPKSIWGRVDAGGVVEREWQLQDSIRAALEKLARRGRPAVGKVYLCSCYSDNDKDLVDGAFKIPSVTHVVTGNDTIELSCGSIAGAVYPTFEPQPVRVMVWIKEGDNQIRLTPNQLVGEGQKFDVPTNTVKDRRCPSTEALSGSTTFYVGYWNTATAAIAGGTALLPTTAKQEANQAFASYTCPYGSCSDKQLGPISSAGSTVSASLSWLASAIYWRRSYKARVSFKWSAQVTCR